MPGLNGLRDHPGSQHSLFSNTAGFAPQSQFRQRSRFQFAGQDAGLNSSDLLTSGSSSPSLFSAGLSTGPEQPGHQGQANSQAQHQRHHSDHQLFPSHSGGLAPASLFGGSLGMSSSSSVPQLSMHSLPGSQAQASTAAAAALMGHTGQHGQPICVLIWPACVCSIGKTFLS